MLVGVVYLKINICKGIFCRYFKMKIMNIDFSVCEVVFILSVD